MQVRHSIKVDYEYTNKPEVAKKWLESLPDLFSADFETAVRYSKEEQKQAKLLAQDENLPKKERVEQMAIARADALGHPYHCTITHLSVAVSEDKGYVIIIDSQEIADVVLEFIVTTDKTQVWHNYSYDGRFIMYYGDANAKNVEDTQIFAKTLLNHVEIRKAGTGLKQLAGQWYGDWGISSDNFTIEQQYDEKVLKYAAIDACATLKLWHYLNEFVDSVNEEEADEQQV